MNNDNEIISIDEAIKHCYEVADKKCDDCGKEHLQLAKWLEELKESRETINRQKAEKEAMLSHIKCLQYENDKLRTRNDELNALNKTASQEAIKEFDKRFKETATEITEVKENAFKGCYVISKANLYNLVSEMTEQRKDDEG